MKTSGKFYDIEERNRTIRAIYQNLRKNLTADAAIKQLREQYEYNYLQPVYLERIVQSKDRNKLSGKS